MEGDRALRVLTLHTSEAQHPFGRRAQLVVGPVIGLLSGQLTQQVEDWERELDWLAAECKTYHR